MTFVPRSVPFTLPDGTPISGTHEQLDEPTAPATETLGTLVALKDTPRGTTGERYAAFITSGPAAHLAVRVALDGGSAVDLLTAGPVAAGGSAGVVRNLTVQGVALPHGTVESGPVVVRLVRESRGSTNWLG